MLFKIKKGCHYSNNLIYKLCYLLNTQDRISYNVTFDSNCYYSFNDVDDYDVNKLFGFSLGLHHKNSARFGWNSLNGKIQIYAYCYVDGKRIIKEITSIESGKEYNFTILNKDDKFVFVITSNNLMELYQVSIPKTIEGCCGYMLWPYFGGNKSAPHNMSISISARD